MGPPVDPPSDQIVPLFEAERSRLIELLISLEVQDWRRATPCPGWTVLDLVGHLVGGDLGLLARQRDGHFGTSPPGGLTLGEFGVWLDELQQEWVHAARRISPRLATDLLRWTGTQITELFGGQDPRQVTAHVSWAGPDAVPVWLDQVRELSEYWIHRQQLLHAVGRGSDVEPAVLAVILAGLRWAFPFGLSSVEAEPGATVVIQVTGAAPASWVLVATDGGWSFEQEPGSAVVARVTMTGDDAWRLLSSNLADGAGERLRARSAHGDPRIIDAVLRTRAVIGSPR